jgi:hypothetical protein
VSGLSIGHANRITTVTLKGCGPKRSQPFFYFPTPVQEDYTKQIREICVNLCGSVAKDLLAR